MFYCRITARHYLAGVTYSIVAVTSSGRPTVRRESARPVRRGWRGPLHGQLIHPMLQGARVRPDRAGLANAIWPSRTARDPTLQRRRRRGRSSSRSRRGQVLSSVTARDRLANEPQLAGIVDAACGPCTCEQPSTVMRWLQLPFDRATTVRRHSLRPRGHCGVNK